MEKKSYQLKIEKWSENKRIHWNLSIKMIFFVREKIMPSVRESIEQNTHRSRSDPEIRRFVVIDLLQGQACHEDLNSIAKILWLTHTQMWIIFSGSGTISLPWIQIYKHWLKLENRLKQENLILPGQCYLSSQVQ